MSTVSYYTAEGLKKLREELEQLKHVERPKASQAIAEARDKGDLSENAEYDAAKEAQGMLESKIKQLEVAVSNAKIVDTSTIDTSKVTILTKVTITNLATKKTVTYQLVGEKEADLKAVDYMIKAKINPENLANFLYKLAENENNITAYLTWISTHPESKERSKYIIEYAKNKSKKFKKIITNSSWETLQKEI